MELNNIQPIPDWIETLNISTYSLNAIKKVCYQFSTYFSAKLEKIDAENVKIIFKFLEPVNDKQRQIILNEFYQALLDQDLRETVYKETEGVRNLILAHAFSKTTFIEPD